MTDNNNYSMSDFIFGTLATDDLRIASIKQARSALAHNYQTTPRDPRPSQAVRIDITAGPEAMVSDVFIHYTTNGSAPMLGSSNTYTIPTMRGSTDWDTVLWGYVRHFTGEIPGQNEGITVRYFISGLTPEGKRLWAKDDTGHRDFSYAVDRHRVPTWVQDAVIYQIFMDRFAPSPGRKFNTPSALTDFFGGTLKGVLAKLDHLSALGVNTVWLTPIFPSPSHHGYDITNFRTIEPRLGNKNEFRQLVNEIHQRKMRIVLDFVPNHSSNQHPFFESAQTNPNSPYINYYYFENHPHQYRAFFDVQTLPKYNNDYPPARQYMIDSALYWLGDFGVDGFRLDHAQGPSHDFWTDFYTAVKKANPESFHFGEIVEAPSTLITYEGLLDGALDFNWLQAARKLFAFGTANPANFEQFQSAHEAFFAGRNFARVSFLDNHDMNRFLWSARGNAAKLMQAAVCQFTLSGVPCIYYGTETGLSQQRDLTQNGFNIMEEARLPMNWDEQNRDLFGFYQKLIQLRAVSPAMRQGTRSAWLVDGKKGRYGYTRRAANETIIVALNVADTAQSFALPSATWQNALTGETLGSNITLPATGFVVARQV
jgi:cyclomaltodextrinase / maltogenic alpha-amylase / neopullulanase